MFSTRPASALPTRPVGQDARPSPSAPDRLPGRVAPDDRAATLEPGRAEAAEVPPSADRRRRDDRCYPATSGPELRSVSPIATSPTANHVLGRDGRVRREPVSPWVGAGARSMVVAMVVAVTACSNGPSSATSDATSRPHPRSAATHPSGTGNAGTSPDTAVPGTSEPPRSSEPPGTATTVDPRDERFSPEERDVIAAYRAALDAILQANLPPVPNPDHPALAATMTGAALETARSGASTFRAQGRAIRPAEPSRFGVWATSIGIDEGRATAQLELCTVDDSVTIDASTGATVDDDVVLSRIRATAVRASSGWLIDAHAIDDQRVIGDEEAPCDGL